MPYLGQSPSKGDENNFKILDDISSYTLTFDGSDSSVVSAANDTITSLTHRFVQGQRVTYTDGDGSAIAGLTDATVYFIIKEDHNTIKLATSASNATNGIAVNITGVGAGSSHTLKVEFDGINTKFKATHTTGQKAKITRSAQLVISMNGVIQQPHDTATPSTGFGFDLDGTIVFSQAPVSSDVFWAHVLTNNNVTFDISDNDIDNFTGDGSTVSFNLAKSPPDNRNVLVTVDGVVQYPNDPDGTERSYTVVENVLTFSVAPALGTEVQVRHIGFAGSSSGSGSGGVTSFYGRTGAVVLKSTDNIVANNATFSGDLTVNGTTTTLDTKLVEVDKIEVEADGTNVAIAVTHSGTGDILRLYDGSNKEFSVTDGGTVYVSQSMAFQQSDRVTTAGLLGRGSLLLAGTQQTDFAIRSAPHNSNLVLGVGVTERARIKPNGFLGIGTVDPQAQLHVYDTSAAVYNKIESTHSAAALELRQVNRYGTLNYYYQGTHKWIIGQVNQENDICLYQPSGVSAGTPYRIIVKNDGKIGINTTDVSHLLTVFAQSASSNIARFKAFNGNSNFDIHTDASSHGQARVRNNIGAVKVELNSNGASYFTGGSVGIGSDVPASTLDILNTGANADISLRSTTNSFNSFIFDSARQKDTQFAILDGRWNGNSVARIQYVTGSDDTNYDDGYMAFWTRYSGQSLTERLRITSGGQTLFTGVSGTTPLDIKTSNSTNNAVHPLIEAYADNATYKAQIGLVREGSSGLLGWAFLTNAVGSPTEKLRITSTGQIITNGTANPFPTRGLTIQPNSSQTHNYLSIIAGNTSSVSGVTFGTSADNNANNYRAMFEYYHSGFAHNEGLRFLAAGTEALRIRGGTSNAGDILYGPGDHIVGASPGLISAQGSHNNANVASVLYGIDDGGGYNGMKVINFDDGTYNSQRIEFLTGKGGYSMATVRMGIDENGLVSIGRTISANSSFNASTNQLVVGNGVSNQGMVIYTGASHAGTIIFNDVADGTFQGAISYKHGSGTGDNSLRFTTGGSGEKLRITSDGKTIISSPSAVAQTPVAILDVFNQGTTTQALRVYRNDLNDNTLAAFESYHNALGIVPKMVITSRGKVGINTSNPQRELHVKPWDNNPATAAPGYIRIDSQGSDQSAILELYHTRGNGTDKWPSSIDTVDGGLTFRVATGNNGTPQEKLRIDSSGNVKIGSGAPTDILDVHRDSTTAYDATDDGAQRTHSASITIRNDNGTTNTFSQLVFDTGGSNQSIARIVAIRSGSASNHLAFITEHSNTKAERLRITSNGNVLIGTDSSLSFNGVGQNHNLIVAGDSSDADITDNYNAAITISNKDGTANNTAGLHFAREDTDGNPHYDGASIVAQFLDTMNTGQYPKADLAFLTSTANNNAPSEKMRLKAAGEVRLTSGGFVSKTSSFINISVDTHTWNQDTFYDVIGSNVFDSYTDTFLVQFQWEHEGHGSPYLAYGNFLFTATGANHTGATGRTFQPVQVGHSFHGPTKYFEFRAYATGQVKPGIQAVARGFSPYNTNNYGYMRIKATRIATN